MADETDDVSILYKELDALRPMQRGLQTSIHQAVFVFVVATGGIVAAYPKIPGDYQSDALFVLTQIEFALGVLVIGLLSHHNVATGYAAALESRINNLLHRKVTIFEGHLAQHFYRTRNGAFWWAKYTLFAFLLALFLGVGYWAGDSWVKFCILLGELGVISWLLRRTNNEGRDAQARATQALDENVDLTAGGQSKTPLIGDQGSPGLPPGGTSSSDAAGRGEAGGVRPDMGANRN